MGSLEQEFSPFIILMMKPEPEVEAMTDRQHPIMRPTLKKSMARGKGCFPFCKNVFDTCTKNHNIIYGINETEKVGISKKYLLSSQVHLIQ